MKKFMMMFGMVLSLAALSWPSYAAADASNPFCKFFGYMCSGGEQPPVSEPSEEPHAVPEIDAASSGLALALLAGVLSIARERRRSRQQG